MICVEAGLIVTIASYSLSVGLAQNPIQSMEPKVFNLQRPICKTSTLQNVNREFQDK